MLKALFAVIAERGLFWTICRTAYSLKLKLLNMLPFTEKFFECGPIDVIRLDIFSFDIKKIGKFLKKLPADKREKIILEADEACKGKIKGFSSVWLDYGHPIDWQLNPLTGIGCDKNTKWFSIADFDDKRGDIKVIWEISRFSHFVLLARAFLLTGDKKYYQTFSDQLEAWLKDNKYSYGANFKCGQENALRMVNVLLAYAVFKQGDLITVDDILNVKELVSRSYRKIISNFFYAYRCIKNNHTISELLGMAIGAWCCLDDKQLGKAYKLLDEVIRSQFSDDGGYCQQSFNYQRLAMQDLECVLAVSDKTKLELSPESKELILSSAMLMYQCLDSSGDMPNFGSNDGALVFPCSSSVYRDFRAVINTIHAQLTDECLFNQGIYDEELLWFNNKELRGIRNIEKTSSAFEQAGLFTFCHNNSWLMFIAKPTTGHMDQLHIDLWVNGINVLCDGGTFSYADEIGRCLVSTSAHNTLKCKEREQINRYGPFLTYGQPNRRLMQKQKHEVAVEMKYRNGYTHRRAVSKIENGFLIEDELEAAEGTEFELLFHTPCEVAIDKKSAVLSKEGAVLCKLQFEEFPMIREEKRSLYYMQSEAVKCIYVSSVKTADKRIVKTRIILFDKGDRINHG